MAKFESNPFTSYTPYDYTSEPGFKQAVDNSLAGNMRDCGECHVGGGGMEYLPRNASKDTNVDFRKPGGNLVEADRIPYRDATKFTIDDTTYSAFNYFIDVFDEDGDADKEEVLKQDFAQTGVLEMDCFVCHLDGYSWEGRKAAVRQGAFDASRVTGAGLGTIYNTATGAPGRSVAYNSAKVTADGSGNLWLDASVLGNISATPPTDNCASCHQGEHQVDWKKRGEMDPSIDVHARLGCMGCHERQDVETDLSAKANGDIGISGASKETKLSMCDPAKGGVGPWDNLQNKVDNVGFKTCEDCHYNDNVNNVDPVGKSYGAPNPSAAHTAAGLTAKVAQTGRDGIADASHLDLIACTACHIKKDANLTGGAFVDGTGPDHEGRLADHDNPYVERDMAGNYGFNWANDKKIHPANFLTSFFWRDKNDRGYDINADGRKGGMDAVLPTHVSSVLNSSTLIDNGLFHDGEVSATEIGDHISVLNNSLSALNGQSTDANGSMVKLSFLMVPFTMSHEIAPASEAFGAGGCGDCHGADAGFYNGTVDMQGKSTIAWDAATQTTPMTKVNGKKDASFSHPKLRDKWLARSIPLMLNNGANPDNTVVDGANGLRNPDRSEVLYEATFQKRDTTWHTTAITGGAITIPGATSAKTTKGWLLKLETCPDDGSDCSDSANVTSRTAMFMGNDATDTDLSELLNNKLNNTGFLDDTFGFTVSATASDELVITPASGTKVRISPQTDTGPLKLFGAVYEDAPITPTITLADTTWDADSDGVIDGRSEMVDYLNALGADSGGTTAGETALGIGVDPDASDFGVANVTDEDSDGVLEADKDATVDFTAPTQGNGTFSYTWSFNDGTVLQGSSASRSFAKQGTYQAVLTVLDEEGKVSRDLKYITVKAPLNANNDLSITENIATTYGADLTVSTLPASYDRIRVFWGDGSSQWLRIKDTVDDPASPDTDSDLQLSGPEGPFTHDYVTDAEDTSYTGGETVKVDVLIYEGTALQKHYAAEYTLQ